MTNLSLKKHQLDVAEIHHNLAPSSLYEHAIRFDKGASIAENGALVAYSGAKTGPFAQGDNFKAYEAGATADIKAAAPACLR